jgi:hypothetical protein
MWRGWLAGGIVRRRGRGGLSRAPGTRACSGRLSRRARSPFGQLFRPARLSVTRIQHDTQHGTGTGRHNATPLASVRKAPLTQFRDRKCPCGGRRTNERSTVIGWWAFNCHGREGEGRRDGFAAFVGDAVAGADTDSPSQACPSVRATSDPWKLPTQLNRSRWSSLLMKEGADLDSVVTNIPKA